jgi:hypothetical protein
VLTLLVYKKKTRHATTSKTHSKTLFILLKAKLVCCRKKIGREKVEKKIDLIAKKQNKNLLDSFSL